MPTLRIITIATTFAVGLLLATGTLRAQLLVAANVTDAPAANSLEPRFAGGQEIFRCTFDPAATDPLALPSPQGEGSWPEHWTRERSATHPPYLEVRIDDVGPPDTIKIANSSSHSLRMDLDGGAAAVYSPAIEAQASFTYVFECAVQTDALVHDHASMSVTFYDAQNKVLERLVSAPVGTTTAWTRLRIGPVAPANEKADHAVIGLHLDPGERADLKGTAWFADVRAVRLPRMSVELDHRTHLYLDAQQPIVDCTVSGLEHDSSVDFVLQDVTGRELLRDKVPLKIDPQGANDTALSGSVSWQPQLPSPGFYRARISLSGSSDGGTQQEITLALMQTRVARVDRREIPVVVHSGGSAALDPGHPIPDQAASATGEFGWTLPQGEAPLTLAELSDLAAQGGIGWLKIPAWNDNADRNDALAAFALRLETVHVQLIGMLADAPEAVRKTFGEGAQPVAAQIFSAKPEVWFPSLEPVVEQLSRQIHWWQLGRDDDFSFAGDSQLAATIEQVRKQLSCYGQKANVGFAWPASQDLPTVKPTWSFVTLEARPSSNPLVPPFSRGESSAGECRRFVNLDLLPAGQFNSLERARDLSLRMLAAKTAGSGAIFVPELCSTRHGLMNDDGTVGELLLPWRTTAQAIGGGQNLGSLRLAGGSANCVFARGYELVLMLWRDQPGAESIALGDKVRQTDLWGRITQPPLDAQGASQIIIDREPIFLTDLNEPLARWQVSVAVEPSQWSNELGQPLTSAVTVTNPFSSSVTGTVKLSSNQRWRIVPREIPFKLAAGETKQLPFEVTLPLNASSGLQDLRVDFDLAADRRYQFTVYRPIEIGLDDVTIELATHLNELGELVVEQKLVNKTDVPVSYKCSLFATDRRRMTTQVLNQGHGSDIQTYRLPNGRALVGQTLWLQAVEADGRRILNYRFEARP